MSDLEPLPGSAPPETPPPDLDEEPAWFYLRADQTLGPVTARSLRAWLGSGFLSGSSLVWRDGMRDWARISTVDLTRESEERGFDPGVVPSSGRDARLSAGALESNLYAGFWRRLAAYIIDNLLLTCALLLALFPRMLGEVRDPEALSRDPVLLVSSLALSFAYFVIWESSAWQATPGKRIMHIRVTDLEGRRLSFFQAALRHLGKIVSSLTFYLGFVMAAFTSRRQALHDLMSGCLVVRDQ